MSGPRAPSCWATTWSWWTTGWRARRRLAALRDAMLELDDQERTVLSLYYFEELTLARDR